MNLYALVRISNGVDLPASSALSDINLACPLQIDEPESAAKAAQIWQDDVDLAVGDRHPGRAFLISASSTERLIGLPGKCVFGGISGE